MLFEKVCISKKYNGQVLFFLSWMAINGIIIMKRPLGRLL